MYYLRLHHEARTDAKLESLSDAQFRVWFKLLCYANEQPERGVVAVRSYRLLALEVARGNEGLLRDTLDALRGLLIVDESALDEDGNPLDDEGNPIEGGLPSVRFINWEKRQYDHPSDAPDATRARKAESRARARGSAHDGTQPRDQGVPPRDTMNGHGAVTTGHDRSRDAARMVTTGHAQNRVDEEEDADESSVDENSEEHTTADADDAQPPVNTPPARARVSDAPPKHATAASAATAHTVASEANGELAQIVQMATGMAASVGLSKTLARYLARASPDEIAAEAYKAADWCAEQGAKGHTVPLSLRFLDNWLGREFPRERRATDPSTNSSNGHRDLSAERDGGAGADRAHGPAADRSARAGALSSIDYEVFVTNGRYAHASPAEREAAARNAIWGGHPPDTTGDGV